jgi:hypothetical protein
MALRFRRSVGLGKLLRFNLSKSGMPYPLHRCAPHVDRWWSGKRTAMPSPRKKIRPRKATAAKLRSWRVAILRNRSHYLGDVQAPDEKAAEAAAVVEFKLSADQLKRVVVQERD